DAARPEATKVAHLDSRAKPDEPNQPEREGDRIEPPAGPHERAREVLLAHSPDPLPERLIADCHRDQPKPEAQSELRRGVPAPQVELLAPERMHAREDGVRPAR